MFIGTILLQIINLLLILFGAVLVIGLLKKRGDKKEEADRRIKADSVDFKNVVDIVDKIFYNNETNDLDEVVKKVHEYIKYRNEDKN